MTIDEFLQKLRENRPLGGWQLKDQRYIRCNGDRDCPVSWVARRLGDKDAHVGSPFTTAERLTLDGEDAAEIIYAADGLTRYTERTTGIRARLLDACGLTEAA